MPQGDASPIQGGRGKEAKIGYADPLEKTSQTCFLSATTAKTIPADARFVSVRIKGDEFPVANAGGVLTWICKKACLSDAKRLQKAMRGFRPQWMRMTSAGMGYPMTIAYNCYIDLDATDSTLLFRAAKVMEWVAWPHNAVSLSYVRPTPPPPAAVVAKMLVKQAVGKSPTPAPVTATEKPIEPPGVTPTESAEGGHAGRVTLPHGSGDIETDLSSHAGRMTLPHEDAHVEASPKPAESGHAERASRSDLNGRGERPARPPDRAHAKETSENAPAAKAIPSTANGVIGTYRIEDLIDPKSLDPRNLYGKRVMRLTVEGCDYDVLSWRKCFNVFVKHCFVYHPCELRRFNWSTSWDRETWPLVRRIYPGPTRYEVVETEEKDPVRLVTALIMLRRGCRIRREDVRIVCEMKREKPATTKPVESGHAGTRDPTDRRSGIAGGHAGTHDPTNGRGCIYDSRLATLLQERFSNGVRPASVIDQNKIRRAYVERYGKTLPDDMRLEQTLLRIGILNDGKVFPRPNSDNGGWIGIIERLIEAGHRFFYYSCVLESHAAELMSAGVTSADMLKQLLEEDAAHSFVIGRNAFSCPDGPTKVIGAIEAVVGDTDVVLSEKDVCRKLPYVPSKEIHSVLTADGTFFWNSSDTYVMPDRVAFDDQELECSLLAVRKGISEREYFSLSQLDFGESAALNDSRITVFAYRKVFSARFLVGEFDVRGQIVCRPGAEIDGGFPLRDYCRTHSEITLDQFLEVAKEFNIRPETALVTAYEEMVRVSKGLFVSPTLVTFDAAATDADLARHCEQGVTSLNSVGDLSDFSAVPGYVWNRFLLDSYLRRESQAFAIRSISMPAKEVAGVIVRRDGGLDGAAAAFAEIAVGNGVAADAHEVGEFLVATRCTLKRGPLLIAQVVSKMRDLYGRKR